MKTPPQPVAEIAREAAEAIQNQDNFRGVYTPDQRTDRIAALILTAAAKMVQQSGAVQALEKWDDESAIITPPDQKDFVDVQMSPEAYEGLYAALHSLRSITGEAQPSPADPADA